MFMFAAVSPNISVSFHPRHLQQEHRVGGGHLEITMEEEDPVNNIEEPTYDDLLLSGDGRQEPPEEEDTEPRHSTCAGP